MAVGDGYGFDGDGGFTVGERDMKCGVGLTAPVFLVER